MKTHIRFNLSVWLADTDLSGLTGIIFGNPTNFRYNTFSGDGVTTISFTYFNGDFIVRITRSDSTENYTNSAQILPLSTNSQYIEFDAELNEDASYFYYLNKGEMKITDNEATTLYLYTQDSENNEISKTITPVRLIVGVFNHSIGIKNINIDVTNVPRDFNYVYIPRFNRYYYVDSIEIISTNITRLHLKEDVLMSWDSLIRDQSAFVLRYAGSDNDLLIDDRLPTDDILTTTYTTPTNGSFKNVTFSYDQGSNYNFMVSSISNVNTNTGTKVSAPALTGLPDISTHLSVYDCIRFVNKSGLSDLILACYNDDTSASFVNSVLWLPFNPITIFSATTSSSTAIYAETKFLSGPQFKPTSSTDAPTTCYKTNYGSSPYLILGDFTIPALVSGSPSYLDYKPYCYYEIYIPFVGWVEVDPVDVLGKRLLVYYSFDFKTGVSTAFIYNYTNSRAIWSGTCQIAIKIDITTTNMLENTRQKQANDQNMILSLIGAGISGVVGAYTGNGVALAGAVLTGTKAIASYVNANKQLYDRASTTFGSSDGALHNPYAICYRRKRLSKITIDTTTYARMQGKPYNTYVDDMNSLSGYAEIGEIHFNPNDNVIYQDEITEIEQLLKTGVIF